MLLWRDLSDLSEKDVQTFCEQHSEGIHVDYKRDMPGKLEKTLASFANTQGGVVILGVEEEKQIVSGFPGVDIEGRRNWEDDIRQKALNGIYPPISPEIAIVPFEKLGPKEKGFVLIRVMESREAPHAVFNKTVVPVRCESITDPVQTMDIDRIEYLLKRRETLEAFRDRLFERSTQIQQEYVGEFPSDPLLEVWIVPTYPHKPLISLGSLSECLSDVSLHNRLANGAYLRESKAVPEGMFYAMKDDSNKALKCLHLDQYGGIRYARQMWHNRFEEPKKSLRGIDCIGEFGIKAVREKLMATFETAQWYHSTMNWAGQLTIRATLRNIRGFNISIQKDPFRDQRYISNVGETWAQEFVVSSRLCSEDGTRKVAKALLENLLWPFQVKKKLLNEYFEKYEEMGI